jgi:Na+-transporting methylmalonyl-CoA/oxaloacetate decarboxylase gamma subunit
VYNTNGLRDEYGHLGGWIELYNAGYGKVNIAGGYLKVKGKEYRIPRGDPNTIMHMQGYCVFYAGGTPAKGTFHTNFSLDDTDFIEFYDVDGKLINTFRFNPADMKENVSYGWLEDKKGKEKLANLPATTPGANNNTEEKIPRGEQFRQADPTGIVLTITAVAAVAVALVILYLIFKYMGEFYVNSANKKAQKARRAKQASADLVKISVKGKNAVTNDELAAIAIALFKYSEDLHDIENTVLTINRAAKAYSPWSSKIYGLTQLPNKK